MTDEHHELWKELLFDLGTCKGMRAYINGDARRKRVRSTYVGAMVAIREMDLILATLRQYPSSGMKRRAPKRK